MKKFKSILIQIIDFIIGIIVFYGSVYGTALLVNELLGFSNSNVEVISKILAFILIFRLIFKISTEEKRQIIKINKFKGDFFMKNKLFVFIMLVVIFCSITFANSTVQDVYYSSFPITVNGQSYTSEMPILNYQGRTYLPLREFGNATGINVDFVNNTIAVSNNDYTCQKYFLKDAYMILDTLSQLDKNNELLYGYYIDFLTGSDPYASSNMVTTIQNSNLLIENLNNSIYLRGFQTFGTALGLDDDYSLSIVYNYIFNYLTDTKAYQTTVENAMYLKSNSSQVMEAFNNITTNYTTIQYKLILLVGLI